MKYIKPSNRTFVSANEMIHYMVGLEVPALMIETAMTSETLVTSTRLHGTTTQKTAIFVLTAVRTSNPTYEDGCLLGCSAM
jgi:N-acetylmuramic acid 6-phosphate (MurNAc-6-P) etherase